MSLRWRSRTGARTRRCRCHRAGTASRSVVGSRNRRSCTSGRFRLRWLACTATTRCRTDGTLECSGRSCRPARVRGDRSSAARGGTRRPSGEPPGRSAWSARARPRKFTGCRGRRGTHSAFEHITDAGPPAPQDGATLTSRSAGGRSPRNRGHRRDRRTSVSAVLPWPLPRSVQPSPPFHDSRERLRDKGPHHQPRTELRLPLSLCSRGDAFPVDSSRRCPSVGVD